MCEAINPQSRDQLLRVVCEEHSSQPQADFDLIWAAMLECDMRVRKHRDREVTIAHTSSKDKRFGKQPEAQKDASYEVFDEVANSLFK